jgi:endonuclease YncB( thermonuclease family)
MPIGDPSAGTEPDNPEEAAMLRPSDLESPRVVAARYRLKPQRRSASRLASVACLGVYVGVLGSLATAAAEQFAGRVTSVVDGDTIDVLRDGREVRIRLEGIDCPEDGQDFGNRTKQFTRS